MVPFSSRTHNGSVSLSIQESQASGKEITDALENPCRHGTILAQKKKKLDAVSSHEEPILQIVPDEFKVQMENAFSLLESLSPALQSMKLPQISVGLVQQFGHGEVRAKVPMDFHPSLIFPTALLLMLWS